MQSHKFVAVLWLVVITLPAIGALPPPSRNCQRKCGDVDIPYPFGIWPDSPDSPDHCAIPGFNLNCTDTDEDGIFKPSISNVEVLSIMLQQGQARIKMDMSYSCYNTTTGDMYGDNWRLNLSGTPYRFSNTGNKFTVIGCQTLAYIGDYNYVDNYMSGCVAMCAQNDMTTLSNGSCSGIGCCQTTIPQGLDYYRVWFDQNFNTSQIYNTSPCSYAALIETSNFTFSTSYPTSSSAFPGAYGKQPPVLVDWALGGKDTCEEARKKPGSFACISRNSRCLDSSNGPGYICNCSNGFQGNPYLLDGCKDIDECNDPKVKYPCSVNGTCINNEGAFQCICPPHSRGNAYSGTCDKEPFGPKTKIYIGTCAGILVGLILFLSIEWIKHKRRILSQENERKMNECFQKNGGQLLTDMMQVECNNSFKLYCRKEIESATNNFDNSSIIGEGGQGTVYRGHNLDANNDPVAIKRCKGFDESKRMEFGKELFILSRVNHPNIVKLLGCSLQFEAPVLVYEYVPNQTLHYLIHSQNDASIRTLDIRLKIAADSAEALAYLHTLNHPIFHGDVKSLNILLGDSLSAKIADFGCSMIRSTNENVQEVKGTHGYLDPEYLLNYELTDKSDVYSFGVVLLELLTRRKALSKMKESLVSLFNKAVKEGKLGGLLDREIRDQDNMECLHIVAELAGRCLVISGEQRPMMSQVADELRQLTHAKRQHSGPLHYINNPSVVQERSAIDTTDGYTGDDTTTTEYHHSLQNKVAMSIEFVR